MVTELQTHEFSTFDSGTFREILCNREHSVCRLERGTKTRKERKAVKEMVLFVLCRIVLRPQERDDEKEVLCHQNGSYTKLHSKPQF